MAGRLPAGRVILFDDDGYYMGPVIAERLVAAGAAVTLVTPEGRAGHWGINTAEQAQTQARLLRLGVEIVTLSTLTGFDGETAAIACVFTGGERRIAADALVLVTARAPRDALYHALRERIGAGGAGLPRSLRRIGDCDAPGLIAGAVFAGHRLARDLDEPGDRTRVRHDRVFDEGA